MANNEKNDTVSYIYGKSFARFAKGITRFCQDDKGKIYITTDYGVFILNKDRILKFVDHHNSEVKLYKFRNQLCIQNKERVVDGDHEIIVDLLGGAKRCLTLVKDSEYHRVEKPVNLGEGRVNTTYQVSSKDGSICQCYKGYIINYINMLLDKGIKYSVGSMETEDGSSTILKAESSKGKAYIYGLKD